MNDWNGNRRAVFVTNGDTSHSTRERESRDYYATDPRAVEELLKRETFSADILEPACGGGHVSEVLKAHGYDVVSADIVKRDYSGQDYTADFLRDGLKWAGDIITNPPYKYAAEFVQHALDVINDGQKVAMFLKLTFLEGEKRRALFQQHPPRKIYVFTKRINCALNGEKKFFNASSAVCYAWFVWEKGSQQKPVIDWI
jgi:hypothetical protein